MVPGDGMKLSSASSALTRNSIAAPTLSDLRLGDRERFARRHPQLLLDEVDPGDHLGDGMLHLDPGVHLDEVEAPLASSRNSIVPAFV